MPRRLLAVAAGALVAVSAAQPLRAQAGLDTAAQPLRAQAGLDTAGLAMAVAAVLEDFLVPRMGTGPIIWQASASSLNSAVAGMLRTHRASAVRFATPDTRSGSTSTG